ncbi:glycosyltransferase [Enterovibrio norvegicus]|uniref:glycosyltransferase n=1 Tax=Enterovibrio norvegicus TaxID=188144 RepID=UPI00389B3499
MRILHVVGGLDTGGIENWLLGYFNIAKRNGMEMDVLTCDTNKLSLIENEAFNKSNVIIPRSNNIFSRISILIRVLLKNNYDAVHCHTDLSTSIYFVIAKVFSKSKLICHSHTDRRIIEKNANSLRKIYICISKILIVKLGDSLVAVSKAAGESLYLNGFSVEYCGVEVNLEKIKDPALEDLDGKKLIFHIGRLSKPKNHYFILDLAEKFRNETDFHFIMIGDGEERENLFKYYERLGINNVTFLGQRNDVHAILWSYEGLVILPSLWEGLPLSLIESQKCGKNCLTSTNVTKEVNVGGVRFLPLDLDSWFDSIHMYNFKDKFHFDGDDSVFSYKSNIDYFKSIYKS